MFSMPTKSGRLRNYQWTEPLHRDERNTSGRFWEFKILPYVRILCRFGISHRIPQQ